MASVASLTCSPSGLSCRSTLPSRQLSSPVWSVPVVPGRGSSCPCRASSNQIEETATSAGSPNHLQSCLLSAVSAVAAAAALLSSPTLPPALALSSPIADVAVLITGQPIKDARALLRYALPIENKAVRGIQQPLEDITEDLRVPGVKALSSVESHVRAAARVLTQNKASILADVAPAKRDEAVSVLEQLQDGLQALNVVCQEKRRDAVVPAQRQLLSYLGTIEESMVDKFPYDIPAEFAGRPVLKGRANVEVVIKPRNNPNLETVTLQMVVDGYNAPVSAGNFVDLVERKFYDGMAIQRADGFVVQTGKPQGKEEGFVDPSTGKVRNVPLEIMIMGEKEPVYHETLEDLGRYKALTRLPFNAFGTLAMAREEFDNDSGSSQIFWLLKESELTPSSANILDGRYAVFGYVVESQDSLADLKVGDVIESMRVTDGLNNLVQA